ncbi:MAG: methyltransferase domain-containing protein, partial [Candidatus Solibacter sp.]
FDRMAADYDAQWTATPVGRAQRDQVWRVLDAMFPSGSRVLDVGCGTGEDALHLMARGVDVLAVDASQAMVAIAQSQGVATEVRRAEDLVELAGTFDGAISNFGALNCVADLPSVARELGRVVRPGGRVAICLIGRCCLWESLYFGLRMQFRKAFRRRRASSYRGMTVYYPTVAEVRAAFAEGFELGEWRGVGLLVPPSYVKLPSGVVRALAACDRVLAGLPLLRAMADHRLFVLVRK